MANAPIADLSYRNYDGPLESPTMRWWVIAKQVIRAALKKRSIWVWTFLSSLYYVLLMVIIFFTEQQAARMQEAFAARGGGRNGNEMLEQFMSRIVWKDQFLHGLSIGQLWFFIITLSIGVGTIANDNRVNALLVYLSKPCEKKDYVFGKWMGVFLVLLGAMAIPTLLFYAYGAMSYRDYGFIRDDPWLIAKILFMLPVLAAFYASLAIGISSLFNQGRIAGAAFAGVYFITLFFTNVMKGIWLFTDPRSDAQARGFIKYLYYASVDGIEIGFIKSVLNTGGSTLWGLEDSIRPVPAPPFWLASLAIVSIGALALFVAWKRVRAVEVVG